MPERVCIGLGSNIEPERHLREAAAMLRERWPKIRFSSVYRSAPVGKLDQTDFLNAVATFETQETAASVHAALREIERALGKRVTERFGPRTMDLDLLLYGDEIIESPALIVPHPRMHKRRFVLEPLDELKMGIPVHPLLQRTWSELSADTAGQQIYKRAIKL